jgi:hypothetical protein
MKNYNIKGFIFGLLIGAIAIAVLFTGGRIKSAKYEGEKNITKHEEKVIQKPQEDKNSNEEPTSTADSAQNDSADKASLKNETDKKALDIMQRTGNWSYVEPLFTDMTPEGVQAVVNLYIQKTGNYKKAESALPYINGTNSNKSASDQPKTKSDYDSLASKAIGKTGDIHNILIYIPHMSTDKVDKIVKEYIDKTNDFNCSYSIRQYMSTKGIDDMVKSYIDRTGDYGTV